MPHIFCVPKACYNVPAVIVLSWLCLAQPKKNDYRGEADPSGGTMLVKVGGAVQAPYSQTLSLVLFS